MGQNKGIAQRIFNKKNFGTLMIDLILKNLTSSLSFTSGLELQEFHEDHLVLGASTQFGALGHQVILGVKIFSDQTREKELFHFESKCKVIYFEKKIQEPTAVFIAHLSPEAGDHANWKRLTELYAEKQVLVNEYLGKIRGTG